MRCGTRRPGRRAPDRDRSASISHAAPPGRPRHPRRGPAGSVTTRSAQAPDLVRRRSLAALHRLHKVLGRGFASRRAIPHHLWPAPIRGRVERLVLRPRTSYEPALLPTRMVVPAPARIYGVPERSTYPHAQRWQLITSSRGRRAFELPCARTWKSAIPCRAVCTSRVLLRQKKSLQCMAICQGAAVGQPSLGQWILVVGMQASPMWYSAPSPMLRGQVQRYRRRDRTR